MLSMLNRYSHGYVAIPVIHACKKQGLFQTLQLNTPVLFTDLVKQLKANSGSLQIALHLLESLNWVSRNKKSEYFLTPESELAERIPDDIPDLLSFPMEAYLEKDQTELSLRKWISLSKERWNVDSKMVSDFLDGMLIIPLFLTLKDKKRINDSPNANPPLFCDIADHVEKEITDLFRSHGWIQKDDPARLSNVGQFVANRIFISATVASYRPMFMNISELLFGDYQSVFQRDEEGHEMHVDRRLNVIGSGFQHEKFFADMEEVILSLFNRTPFENQPKYIADMGCGDGTLLKKVYEIIRDKSLRGKVLDQYPIKMIGVDYNEAALDETTKLLKDIDHIVMKGDIGDPKQMIEDFKKIGIHDPENMLHVRSFLDHDRPFIAPTRLEDEKARSGAVSESVYCDNQGQSIKPESVIQSLVEHLERWSSIMGNHGMIILECHCLSPKAVHQFVDKSENLHFDAYHRFSGQLLIEADEFILHAAEVGLFTGIKNYKYYPKTLAYTRVTLNHFEKRNYSVRHARPEDMPVLLELEKNSLSGSKQASDQELWQRLEENPEGQCVIAVDGAVVAAIYTQRIATDDKGLENYTNPTGTWNHDEEGNLVELVSLRCRFEEHGEYANDLLDFVEYWSALKSGVEKVAVNPICYQHHEQNSDNAIELLSKNVDQYVRQYLNTFALDADRDSLYPEKELEAFGAAWLLHEIQAAGFLNDPSIVVTITDLKEQMGLLPKYDDLFRSLMGILERYDLLKIDDDRLLLSNNIQPFAKEDVAATCEEFEQNFLEKWPNFGPFKELMFTCLKDYVAVLTGKKTATDVVFPDGSMDLFSGIFYGDEVAEFFNKAMAEVLHKQVKLQLRGNPEKSVNILEIGAGTGGTSRGVLKRLKEFGYKVNYYYTDISSSFTRHGARVFGEEYPWVVFKRLDIEKDLKAQGFDPESFDIVYASNVLHDTEYILETLSKVRNLLKPGGMMALNEYTRMKDLLLFTGGLLHGWWLFKDPENRLPNSCLMSVELWKQASEKTGFTSFEAYKLPYIKNSEDIRQSVMTCYRKAGEFSMPEAVSKSDAVAVQTETKQTTAPVAAKKPSAGIDKKFYEVTKDSLREIVGEDRMEQFGDNTSLMDAGLDSIELLEFRALLEKKTDQELDASFLFEFTTIKQIANHFHDELGGETATEAEPVAEQESIPTATAKSSKESLAAVKELVMNCLTEIVGEDRIHKFGDKTSLMDASLDSIEMLEFRSGLERQFSLDLDATFLFEYPTLGDVVSALEKEAPTKALQTAAPVVEPVKAEPVQAVPTPVEPVKVETPSTPEPQSLTSRQVEETIAIIGMACSFPGSSDTPDKFWDFLGSGVDAVRELPKGRWEWPEGIDPTGNEQGIALGGFLNNIANFDAEFFQISPKEAKLMDPQQRMLLELSWEAMENAGYSPENLYGSATGVFIGACSFDYKELLEKHLPKIEAYQTTGSFASILSNRISFYYNFHGPSLTVDTACSSSLFSIYHAISALKKGECTQAIAGGVNLLCSPTNSVSYYRAGMLSKEGRCKTFDQSASGFARGEGGGLIVLKPLNAAIQDGDQIYGVVKGVGTNHGGKASSLTAPNPAAQADLIHSVYQKSDIDVASISYIETHGTGTPLGDPIEVDGLKKAFNRLMEQEREEAPSTPYCALGSVKTNIGHLEGAAGVAGVIKVLLALKHKQLPQNLHFKQLNPYINLEGSPFYVVQRNQRWNRPEKSDGSSYPRRAGISAFGFGGANVHLVLEEYPTELQSATYGQTPERELILLSASSEEQLKKQVYNLKLVLEDPNNDLLPLREIAFTLQAGRTHFPHRLATVAENKHTLLKKLESFLKQEKGWQEDFQSGVVTEEKETDQSEKFYLNQPESLAELWVAGKVFDWDILNEGFRKQRTALPTYPFQRKRYWLKKKTETGIKDQHLFYDIQWEVKKKEKPEATPENRTKHWLIFTDTATTGANLTKELDAQNIAYTLVDHGESFQNLGGNRFVCNPSNPDDFNQLLDTAFPAGNVPERVAHLWSLDAANDLSEKSGDKFDEAQKLGCGSVIYLTQELVKRNWEEKCDLWLVTRGSEAVDHHSASTSNIGLAQAPLWGLGRIIALEHPTLWGGLVDLDFSSSNEEAFYLFQEIQYIDEEDQIALRAGKRFVPRLAENTNMELGDYTLSFEPNHSYLITGGLGGIGLKVATWMVKQGAKNIILSGRTGLPDRSTWEDQKESRFGEAIKAVQAMEAQGANVMIEKVDVNDEEQLSNLFGKFGVSLPALRGIVHAAGILRYQSVLDSDLESLQTILAPKVQGAWMLHHHSLNFELDFFVTFSSISAVWGSKELASYAAGNHFLDALCYYRQRQGLPALSINWGPWAEVGMASKEMQATWSGFGINPLTNERGIEALEILLNTSVTEQIVSDVDWSIFKDLYTTSARKHLLDLIAANTTQKTKEEVTVIHSDLFNELQAMKPEERRESLIRYITKQVLEVLGVDPDENPDTQTPFMELGVQSFSVIELSQILSKDFGINLPTTAIYDYANIELLAEHLLQDQLTFDELQAENAEERQEKTKTVNTNEPVAIIGAGCRLPGGVTDMDSYWQLLRAGADVIQEIPESRWNHDLLYDPEPGKTGKIYTKEAGFLDDIDQFDPLFFGISTKEAATMDPQHRILLEVTWEAIENAGQSPKRLEGTRTGIFLGTSNHEYAQLQVKANDPAKIESYYTTGTANSIAAGRLSYFFNFQGPCLTVDTACSTSLVAMHLGTQSLQNGECDIAISGGVNLILSPDLFIGRAQSRMLAPDGRCKAFDSRADGFVPSEGCGMIIMKRLSEAQSDQDRILAVIRGSAINQDGRSNGLTAPSGLAQQSVIQDALANAGIKPAQVDYVETHGTGTALGDPVEIQSLGEVYGKDRATENPLLVGAVKTNLGHLEAAAGIAGVLKAILALQNFEIPKQIHFKEPNPHITWENLPVSVVAKNTPWLRKGESRIAGVSSFGFSGTNAHILLEEAPVVEETPAEYERPYHLLTISAKSKEALNDLVGKYAQHLSTTPNASMEEITHTTNVGRAHFPHRTAVFANSATETAQLLARFEQGTQLKQMISGEAKTGKKAKIAFLFTGQGSQYIHMGQELYKTQPVFRKNMDLCDQLLQEHLGESILSIIYPTNDDATKLNSTGFTQPALFAFEYSLAQMWISWGVTPSLVMGHSVGEFVSACIAGVFDPEDALKLIAYRAKLMQALPPIGKMTSVQANEEYVAKAIAPYFKEISIAAINGPSSVVISGEKSAVEDVTEELNAKGIKTRDLTVSHAFHSSLMELMIGSFKEVASKVTYGAPKIDIVSNLTGELIKEGEITADYWCEHILKPVQFYSSMKTVQANECEFMLEIGPSATLLSMGRRCLEEEEGQYQWLPSVRGKQYEWTQLMESVAKLYIHGVEIDWESFHSGYTQKRVSLPTYPFQREKYWLEPIEFVTPALKEETIQEKQIQVEIEPQIVNEVNAGHPQFGKKVESPMLTDNLIYENVINTKKLPFLDDHRIHHEVVVPGSFHMSTLLALQAEVYKKRVQVLKNVTFFQTLLLPDQDSRKMQIVLKNAHKEEPTYEIYSRDQNESGQAVDWNFHGTGNFAKVDDEAVPEYKSIESLQKNCTIEPAIDELYEENFWNRDLQLTSTFRWLAQLWVGDHEALGLLKTPGNSVANPEYSLHAGLIDSCMQVMSSIFIVKKDVPKDALYIPFVINEFKFYGTTQDTLYCHAEIPEFKESNQQIFEGRLCLFEESGRVVAELNGIHLKRANRELIFELTQEKYQDWFYSVQWQQEAARTEQSEQGSDSNKTWMIFSDGKGVGEALAAQLKNQGKSTCLVYQASEYSNDGDQFYLDSLNPAHFERLLEDALLKPGKTAHAVCYLWGIDDANVGEMELPALKDLQKIKYGGALHLIQSLLSKLSSDELPKFWGFTQNGETLNELPAEPVSPFQGVLWGMFRVLSFEHPELWGGSIDLADQFSSSDFEMIINDIAQSAKAEHLAYRDGERYTARLTPVALAKKKKRSVSVNPNSTYLITGGLKGLGLEVAKSLVEQGAGNLVLLGRTGSYESIRGCFGETEDQLNIKVAQVDISDEQALKELLVEIQETMPPLRGVVHSAGILKDGLLLQQKLDDFEKVMAPKVLGAWNLHKLTAEMPLDFFVLFSSASALLGSHGQGNYAASNAFMDSLAQYRNAIGLAALSINWGPWDGVGMAVGLDDQAQAHLTAMGWSKIGLKQGLQSLKQLLTREVTHVGVLSIDWQRFANQFPVGREPALISGLTSKKDQSEVGSQSDEQTGNWFQELKKNTAKLSENKQRKTLVQQLQKEIEPVLPVGSASLDPAQSLFEAGLDSMMSLELKNKFQKLFECSIPTTLIFDYPTINDLARYISEKFLTEQQTDKKPERQTGKNSKQQTDKNSEQKLGKKPEPQADKNSEQEDLSAKAKVIQEEQKTTGAEEAESSQKKEQELKTRQEKEEPNRKEEIQEEDLDQMSQDELLDLLSSELLDLDEELML